MNESNHTNNSLKKAFEKTAEENLWSDPDSLSGRGSNLFQTRIIREEIPKLLKRLGVRSFFDAPCGDVFWMKTLFPFFEKNNICYTGGDIVESLIQNNKKSESGVIKFIQIDLSTEIAPTHDLVFTRDCFIHLSFDNIFKILQNYKKAKFKYLLVNTYTNTTRVNENVDGFFIQGRMLNLQKFPFNFKEPIVLINEGCTEDNGIYDDKSLALWRLQDINLSQLKLNLFRIEISKKTAHFKNLCSYYFKRIKGIIRVNN